MLQDFKKFAMRGNVMDMAIGIVLGAAFGAIVDSFVKDVLMPPIGMMMDNVDFTKFAYVLQTKTAEHAAISINYGLLINAIINFIIVAFAIFMVVKQMNRFQAKDEKEATTKACPYCKSDINIEATRCAFCTAAKV